MKRIISIILALVVVFSFAGCGTAKQSDAKEASNSSNVPFEESDAYYQTKKLLNNNLAQIYPKYDYNKGESVFTISCTAPDGTAEALVSSPDSMRSGWTEFTDSIKELSSATYQYFVASGYDVDCIIIILNDKNPDKVLYSVYNGVCISDILQ